jgi:predicted DCC family thiol-disulfide oxidoreductase YuxK
VSKLLVWYDGGCLLCRREIAFMRRLDRRHAIDFQDVASATGLCPIDRADLLRRFHAQEDGNLLSGAAAFAAMWRAIPAFRPFGMAARNPLILASLERIYKTFLRLRPRLQNLARWAERKRQ